MSDTHSVSADLRRPRAESVGRAFGVAARRRSARAAVVMTRRRRSRLRRSRPPTATSEILAAHFVRKSYRKGPIVDSGAARRRAGRSRRRVRLDHRPQRLRQEHAAAPAGHARSRPTAGEICFEGHRIDNLPSAGRDILRNRYFGMVFQFYHLLPELTMLENVLMPAMIGAGHLRLSGEPPRASRSGPARCSRWSASAIG